LTALELLGKLILLGFPLSTIRLQLGFPSSRIRFQSLKLRFELGFPLAAGGRPRGLARLCLNCGTGRRRNLLLQLLNLGLEQADRLLVRDLPVQLGLSRFDFFHSYVTGNAAHAPKVKNRVWMAWHKSKDRRDGKLRGEMENSSAKDELQFKIFCEMLL
jgi:hypothetical protein